VVTERSFFKHIYIVDNSDIDNRELSEKITNSIYISNGKNLGIAEALNIGCSAAYNEGFEYCMTMDQDSVWDVDNLRSYLDEIDCNFSDSTALYAPSMHVSDDSFSIIGDIKRIFIKQKNIFLKMTGAIVCFFSE
ncbi:MAG: glycosyltransferase, partial [Spirochaetaceae bacterium]|nr:glycosyltransferase [Spirochaetaceae bacterium]